MPQPISRQVWLLAWPMILSNLTVPLLGLVDTAILGHLSQPYYLGAVAIGGIIFNMLLWSFAFLRMGTTGLSAQAFGANEEEKAKLLLLQSLVLAFFFGLCIIILRAPIFDLAFAYMAPSADVEEHARIYCQIRVFAAPASLANFVIMGWLLAAGKARTVLLLAVLTNAINIVLDYLLVVQVGMFTDGVAIGSLCADYIAFMVGLLIIWRTARSMRKLTSYLPLADIKSYLPLLHLNRHIFIRTLCLLFAFSFFYAQSAQQDDISLSANAILISLLMVFAYGMDGFANAAEVLVGRATGSHNRPLFFETCRTTCVYFTFATLLFIICVAISEEIIIGLLTNLAPVAQAASHYWPWLLVVAAVSAWNFMFDGIFIGATKGRAMQNTMVFSSFLIFLPTWYLSQPLGNHGLWLAFSAFHMARSASMAVVFYYFSKQNLWFEAKKGRYLCAS